MLYYENCPCAACRRRHRERVAQLGPVKPMEGTPDAEVEPGFWIPFLAGIFFGLAVGIFFAAIGLQILEPSCR